MMRCVHAHAEQADKAEEQRQKRSRGACGRACYALGSSRHAWMRPQCRFSGHTSYIYGPVLRLRCMQAASHQPTPPLLAQGNLSEWDSGRRRRGPAARCDVICVALEWAPTPRLQPGRCCACTIGLRTPTHTHQTPLSRQSTRCAGASRACISGWRFVRACMPWPWVHAFMHACACARVCACGVQGAPCGCGACGRHTRARAAGWG